MSSTGARRKVALVRVPEDYNIGLQEVPSPNECLGLAAVAGDLRARGHEAVIIDGTLIDPSKRVELVERFNLVLAELLLKTYAEGGASPHGVEVDWLIRKVLLAQQLVQFQPDVVGFSLVSSLVYARVAELVELLRALGLTSVFCAGGEQATLYASDVLERIPGLDACVMVEGETALAELAEAGRDRDSWRAILGLAWRGASGVVVNERRPLITGLDALAPAARDTLPAILERGGDALVFTSRGCSYNCTFCSIIEFYDASPTERWRPRSPKSVVGELRRLFETFGADRFWVVDDIFFGAGDKGRRRGEAIFREIIEARLPIRFDIFCRANDLVDEPGPGGTPIDLDLGVRAGLRRALVGIESGSDQVLKGHFRKGVKAPVNAAALRRAELAGVEVEVEFIMFDPWTTLEDIAANLTLLREAPRGTRGRQGKYEPQVLTSRLYIHRETPLGRDFLARWAHLLDDRAGTGADFYLPYKFAVPTVGALAHIVESTFHSLAPVARAVDELFRVVDRFWTPSWSDEPRTAERRERFDFHDRTLAEIRQTLDDEALAFFEEALSVVSHFKGGQGPLDETQANDLADIVFSMSRKMATEVDNVGAYVYSLAVEALQHAWDDARRLNVLGRRTWPPSTLVHELGYPRLC